MKTRDLLIIGGGIGGIVCLKYARAAGLDAELVEKAPTVGGLWRDLPPWQDIQTCKEDWTLGDIPLHGEDQAAILANIRAWVTRFDLQPFIRCDRAVLGLRRIDDYWEIRTTQETFRARNVVAATGGHSKPFTPAIDRTRSTLPEFHSTALREPQSVTGKHVVVVGGGASALDLLDLCLAQNAASITWVYRNVRWMVPTTQRKQLKTNIRFLARVQMLGMSVDKLNAFTQRALDAKYAHFGITDIKPKEPFDYERSTPIPGRPLMIKHFSRLKRHRAEVRSLDGSEVILSDGQRICADMVLWGTGFTVDFTWSGLPKLAALQTPEAVLANTGAQFRSLDYPNLYLFGMGVLDTASSTPWLACHTAKAVISDIRHGHALAGGAITKRMNHFDLIKFLARKDRRQYLPGLWYLKYLAMALYYHRRRDKCLPIP